MQSFKWNLTTEEIMNITNIEYLKYLTQLTLGSQIGKFSLFSVGICFSKTGCGHALKFENRKQYI